GDDRSRVHGSGCGGVPHRVPRALGMTDWREQLEADGFALLTGVLDGKEVSAALAEWDGVCRRNAADPAILANDGPAYGARNLLQLWPGVMEFVRHPRLRGPLCDVLGTSAGVV